MRKQPFPKAFDFLKERRVWPTLSDLEEYDKLLGFRIKPVVKPLSTTGVGYASGRG